jgi:hypothetical protein
LPDTGKLPSESADSRGARAELAYPHLAAHGVPEVT